LFTFQGRIKYGDQPHNLVLVYIQCPYCTNQRRSRDSFSDRSFYYIQPSV